MEDVEADYDLKRAWMQGEQCWDLIPSILREAMYKIFEVVKQANEAGLADI
jgi:hypothetical protein